MLYGSFLLPRIMAITAIDWGRHKGMISGKQIWVPYLSVTHYNVGHD